MVRRVLISLALLMPLAVATPAQGASPSPNGYVIGDSITNFGKDELLVDHPTFDVNAVNGRDVDTLPGLVRARLAQSPLPRYWILAEGTNESDYWYKSDLQRVVDMIPSGKIIFVTHYRDPEVFGDRDDTMLQYTRWEKAIAASDPSRVCVASWRYVIEPKKAHLVDGVHPDEWAQQLWADQIDYAIRHRCKDW